MYRIDNQSALFRVSKAAICFYSLLRQGSDRAWGLFKSPEIELIEKEWKLIRPDQKQTVISPAILENGMTGSQLRQLIRALTAFIAAHDGRYSVLANEISKIAANHPNEYALRLVFSEAETARAANGYSVELLYLPKDQEQRVREAFAALSKCFNSPGQVMNPIIDVEGITWEPEPEPKSEPTL